MQTVNVQYTSRNINAYNFFPVWENSRTCFCFVCTFMSDVILPDCYLEEKILGGEVQHLPFHQYPTDIVNKQNLRYYFLMHKRKNMTIYLSHNKIKPI